VSVYIALYQSTQQLLNKMNALCSNLAQHNVADVTIRIHTLPVIAGMIEVDAALSRMFGLLEGKSAETSGGLLMALPDSTTAQAFCDEYRSQTGRDAWIVGDVLEGERSAVIVADPRIINA
jgi:selenide,water dikinase